MNATCSSLLLLKASFFCLLACSGSAQADGRPGSVEWSDGKKLAGAITLTDGTTLKLFTGDQQDSIPLSEVRQIIFTPEKEQMWEGFYFPNAGQATQAKTGEVYPIRYLKTEITLADGKKLVGHLYTTVFYVETDETTEKVVIMAKQTGVDQEKMTDLVYPTAVRFDTAAASTSVQLDLTKLDLKESKPPIIVTRPDLSLVAAIQSGTQPLWTIPVEDPAQLFFSVQAADGFHVVWPVTEPDPEGKAAAQSGLQTMQDFYDDRKMLGCITNMDTGDIYSLAMLRRIGHVVDGGGNVEHDVPWSLVLLGWKYDPDTKKATLLHRALLGIGRETATTPLPAVFKQPELSTDLTAVQSGSSAADSPPSP